MIPSAPVAPSERLIYWDVLRGFALFGVLAANLPFMALSRALDWQSIDLEHGPLDAFAFYAVRGVFDTKFITIFSVLFGAGLALMSEKAIEKGAPFKRVYLRRLAALFVFGIVHALLLWFGDILFHYSIIGFIAMWMRKLRPWLLVVIALSLLILTATVNQAMSTIDPENFIRPVEGKTPEEANAARLRRIGEALASGDFLRGTRVRAELWMQIEFFFIFWAPRTLALFLIGMALVRSGILMRIAEHRHVVRRAIAVGLAVGVPLQALHLLFAAETEAMPTRMAGAVTFFWSAVFLSPAYMGIVALWTESGRLRWLRDGLAAVGRTAFSNYIFQSVIASLIFNYLGQYDGWNRFALLLLAPAIFALEILASVWWLERFRFGPLEWLWRAITYWRSQPLRAAGVA